MIEPSNVANEARHIEEHNIRFRSFLKAHAEADELDEQFSRLHNELFNGYNCCGCNNCCKEYTVFLESGEEARIANYLGLSLSELASQYLEEADGVHMIRKQSCGFLAADGKCLIYECRPSACAGYPFTNYPDRLSSMMSILEFAETCPIVFEMLERLKETYRFKIKRR